MSISSKNNGVTKFNDRKNGFYLNKMIVFGVFLSQRSPWIMASSKQKLKIKSFSLHVHFCENWKIAFDVAE